MPGLPVACYPAAVCLLPRCYLLCSRRCYLSSAARLCPAASVVCDLYCYLPCALLLCCCSAASAAPHLLSDLSGVPELPAVPRNPQNKTNLKTRCAEFARCTRTNPPDLIRRYAWIACCLLPSCCLPVTPLLLALFPPLLSITAVRCCRLLLLCYRCCWLLLSALPSTATAASTACLPFRCCCRLPFLSLLLLPAPNFYFFCNHGDIFFCNHGDIFFLQPWSLLGWTGGDSHSFRVTFIPTPNDSRIHAFTFASSGTHAFRMRRGCTDACAHDVIYPTRTHDSRCDRRSSSIIHHRRCDPTMMLAVDLTLIR
jgi:hypothetical protein